MARTVIRHGMVVTLDDAATYHERGTVVLDDDRIAWVGPDDQAPAPADGDTVIDATDKIVMPGLVDLHFHTALGKGYNDHLPLWEYLDECWYPLIRALDYDAAYWAAMASYAESIKAGVTTVNDMYRRLDALADAAEEIGIRAVLSNDVALDEHDLDTLQDNIDAFQRSHGAANGRIQVRLGIEWLPLASPDLLRETRTLANELGTGIHIHLNESMSEVENSLERFGRRPTELAYELGFLGPDVVAAHCVHLNDAEIRMMAETGTHISHNPSSNAKLGNGIARVPEMIAAGINVGLGHDAVECNNSADMFEVMKYASLMHRASRQDASLMQAGDVLRMATRHGAAALGHDTGRLEAGAKADLILVETNSVEFTPMLRDTATHLTSHLVFAANGSAVDTTIVDGRVLMQGRKLTTVDEHQVVREANAAFRRTVARMEVVTRTS
ncbi:amidohydrolase family protein [Nocardioides mangrovi]|uniref:Amidohydrolase n=1 Tax=Nocardioides mangrovi TaxID=2874580 RepID=A0ABS7UER0_9ACTN|nr:amidohydrolase [Nocardioides mangrovi]MBZ5739496.1 amidohydrolase [Nocardioides mangrovi]